MTKKIAVIGSGSGSNLEAIVKYFKNENYDINIMCVSDKLNSGILKCAERLDVDHKYLPYEQNIEFFSTFEFDLIVLIDYAEELNDDVLKLGKFINLQPSLLPSFKGADAIHRAFVSGVKVSGVTIYYATGNIGGGRIIAQYPILINNTDHFDDFEANMIKLENMLYPRVIKSILDDKVFDYHDMFQSQCNCGSDGNCENCQH